MFTLRKLSTQVTRSARMLRVQQFSGLSRTLCTEAKVDEAVTADDKKKGTCKWFDSKKGFGFISPDDGSPDVFVHQTQIHAPGFRNLADGEPVEFVVEEQEDGKLRAVQVTGPDGAYVQGAPRPAPIGRDDEWNF